MNDDTINDLKQFIAATVSQNTSEFRDEVMTEFARMDKKIDDRSDEILSAIGETTSDRFDMVEEDIKNIDTRVTKLESNNA